MERINSTDPPIDPVPVPEPQQIAVQRKLLNRWSLFALFAISAASTVLYVSNVIAVNRLSAECDALKHDVDSLHVLNQSLRTESYRLQSAERVTRIATEKLGMIAPEEAPTILAE
ncbi:MAG: hypothetical protein EHM43_02695 [Ignavibacteriae bacterium]|nr:MAG: hypothetical protein EHM43_02695 [Ignavibacteriota bacterium]